MSVKDVLNKLQQEKSKQTKESLLEKRRRLREQDKSLYKCDSCGYEAELSDEDDKKCPECDDGTMVKVEGASAEEPKTEGRRFMRHYNKRVREQDKEHYKCEDCDYEADLSDEDSKECPKCGGKMVKVAAGEPKEKSAEEPTKEEIKFLMKRRARLREQDTALYKCDSCGYEAELSDEDDKKCPKCEDGTMIKVEGKEPTGDDEPVESRRVQAKKKAKIKEQDTAHYKCEDCDYEADLSDEDSKVCPECGGKMVKVEDKPNEEPDVKPTEEEKKFLLKRRTRLREQASKYRCPDCGYEADLEPGDEKVCPECGGTMELVEEPAATEGLKKKIKDKSKIVEQGEAVKFKCETCGYTANLTDTDEKKCPECGGMMIKDIPEPPFTKDVTENFYNIYNMAKLSNTVTPQLELEKILISIRGKTKKQIEEELIVKDVQVVKEAKGKGISVNINGKEYRYVPTGNLSPEQLASKFEKMLKYSAGRGLAWLKQNSVPYAGAKGQPPAKEERETWMAEAIEQNLVKKLEKVGLFLERDSFFGGVKNGFYIYANEEEDTKNALVEELEKMANAKVSEWVKSEDGEGKAIFMGTIVASVD